MLQRLDGEREANRCLWVALTPFILQKSRMRKRARTDLCGGRSAMIVPTATISNTVSPVKHFLRHTTASAAKSAPFRFHGKLRAIINQRLACNLAGGTQSDPTISPVATSIMITTSNSLRRERDAQSSGR